MYKATAISIKNESKQVNKNQLTITRQLFIFFFHKQQKSSVAPVLFRLFPRQSDFPRLKQKKSLSGNK